MKDLKYLELKRKGIIDKDDNVQLNGEQVPYYFLNEDCTAFNPPRGSMPYQSDEWFYRFLKKHGRLDTNTNPKVIDFPIPSNDDAKKSIECIVSIVKKAIAEGLEERGVEQEAKDLKKKEKAKQISEEKQ